MFKQVIPVILGILAIIMVLGCLADWLIAPLQLPVKIDGKGDVQYQNTSP